MASWTQLVDDATTAPARGGDVTSGTTTLARTSTMLTTATRRCAPPNIRLPHYHPGSQTAHVTAPRQTLQSGGVFVKDVDVGPLCGLNHPEKPLSRDISHPTEAPGS